MIHTLALSLWLVASGTAISKPKLLVLELTPGGGLEASVAAAMTDAITNEVAAGGFFDVVSSRDVQTLLGHERQKQMVGCSDTSSCLTDLAGAMGARFVLNGSLAKLGETFQLSLQTLDSDKAQPIGRSTRLARGMSELRAQLPFSVAEATATPPPPPASHLMPYALVGAGAAAILGGGMLGLNAFSDEGRISQELKLAERQPSLLRSAAEYQADAQRIATFKVLAVSSVAVGVALIATGLYLNPSDGSVKLAVLPTPSGGALVGVWR